MCEVKDAPAGVELKDALTGEVVPPGYKAYLIYFDETLGQYIEAHFKTDFNLVTWVGRQRERQDQRRQEAHAKQTGEAVAEAAAREEQGKEVMEQPDAEPETDEQTGGG